MFESKNISKKMEFFLNYQQHKIGISAKYFFPFISFVIFIVITHRFGGKCYLIF